MRGSIDVVDAERLQRSGVAIVGLKEEIYDDDKWILFTERLRARS